MKLVETKSWNILKSEFERIKNTSIKSMFVQDENRFVEFSLKFEDILFDYSKNLIDEEVLSALISLAKEANLSEKIELMFGGAKINITENRAVLHTALRNFSDNPVFTDGMDIMPMIIGVRDKMKDFTNQLRNNIWLGYNGDIITDVVNIGIGGSDLGPTMVCQALKPYSDGKINIHFVSNIDGTDLAECLKHLKPETTLFIIASKTFTTLETMTNANSAKDWFFAHSDADQDDVAKHFIALSTNEKACLEFGIPKANMFEFWDWVGGRYSLWSAIGLSIAVYIGYDNFEKLLYGAYLADCHFLETKFERNIPVIMGLLGIWYNNFMNFKTHAIIPYDQYLSKLPEFLQQLDMESNGKYTDIEGNTVDYHTGAVVWGTAGTNSQHSFFQLIHQGTQTIPVDFIVPCISHNPVGDHHQKLLANCFAQSEAMMIGKSEDEVIKELKSQGLDDEKINQLKQHKVFNGNIPTNTFLIKKVTPESLGTLIAFYEHKVFVEGIIWNINSFDQWGVELGKQLAGKILPELKSDCLVKNHDSSTNGLINYYKNVIN